VDFEQDLVEPLQQDALCAVAKRETQQATSVKNMNFFIGMIFFC